MSSNDPDKNKKQGLSRWIVVVAVISPIVILAAIISWLRNERPDPTFDESDEVVSQAAGLAPDRSGEFAVPQSSMGDFDAGRQVPINSDQADFSYQAQTGSNRYFTAQEDTVFAVVGRRESPTLNEVKAALKNRPIKKLDLDDMSPGLWIAVRTSKGNYAAYTIRAHAGISPGTLRLQYLLWSMSEREATRT